jgi:isoleucyl-tRNA synthetase
VFRLVDEWYISMGPVYDKPREQLTAAEVDASLRYQIMDVIRDIKWIPGFGYERELDWLLNMHDWMISKKRYWGLALPIYDCAACGNVTLSAAPRSWRSGRSRAGTRSRATRRTGRTSTPSRIRCSGCGAPVSRITDVGNPWLDAGIVPFSTMHYRSDPDYWKQWFPADFVTESFPGQFRNWFYSLLAMSTVLRRETPFKTLFGYAPSLARTAGRCTRAGATPSSSTRPPSGWA